MLYFLTYTPHVTYAIRNTMASHRPQFYISRGTHDLRLRLAQHAVDVFVRATCDKNYVSTSWHGDRARVRRRSSSVHRTSLQLDATRRAHRIGVNFAPSQFRPLDPIYYGLCVRGYMKHFFAEKMTQAYTTNVCTHRLVVRPSQRPQ